MKLNHTVAPVLALFGLVACGKEETQPPPATPSSATAAAPVDTAPKAATPATPDTAAAPAPATPPATPPAPAPAAAADKTFTHSKLGFSFSYPDTLTVKEDAKGATVSSAQPIAQVEDRSGKSKKPVDTFYTIKIAVEDGAIPAVAKKTNPSFGDAFPKGSEKDFKEQKDFAEKVTFGAVTAYSFVMGSHGEGEHDLFVPGKTGKTIVVKCSLTGDNFKPKMSPADQGAACNKVASTLKP